VSERRRRDRAPIRLGVRRELAVVVGLSLAVLLVIGLGAAFASRKVAQQQALGDAERMTRRLADLVVAPLFPGYLAGDPHVVENLAMAMRNRMSDGYLIEVAVWSADGKVLFSDRTQDIGRRPQPTPVEVPAAAVGKVFSAFEDDPPEPDQTGPANAQVDPGPARYVEVYVPFHLD
jgi:two-component system NarL family sensor kinase